jgi:hypothetical protein
VPSLGAEEAGPGAGLYGDAEALEGARGASEGVVGEHPKMARVPLHVRPAGTALEKGDGRAPVSADGRPYWFVE